MSTVIVFGLTQRVIETRCFWRDTFKEKRVGMDEGERQLDINTVASEYKFIYSIYTAEEPKKKKQEKYFPEGT